MIKGRNVKELKEFCAERGIKWQFATPLAPHQNGATEAMVKTIKTALKKAIGDAVLAPFELYTCLLESYTPVAFQRTPTMVPTYALTISYLVKQPVQSLKVHSDRRKTHVIDLNFANELSKPSGKSGRETYYHNWFQERSGIPSLETLK